MTPKVSDSAVRRVNTVLAVVERLTVGLLLASIVVLVVTQVVARHLLDTPLVWTEEAARFALVWLTFMGAALLALEKGHIVVDLFASPQLARIRRVAEFAASIVQIVACAVVAYAAVEYWSFLGDTRSPALRVPMRVVYVSTAIGFGLWSLHTLAAIPDVLRRRPSDADAGAADGDEAQPTGGI